MPPAPQRRLLHRLGALLFVACCALFFFLPGDAPSSRAKRERPPNPVPWVLWVGLMAGSLAAFVAADRVGPDDHQEAEGSSA